LLWADTRVPWLTAFALLFGAGNGAMTVIRGALPMEMYGRDQYGAIAGALATPGLLARAVGPIFVALLWSALGGYERATVVLFVVAAVGATAFAVATRAPGTPPAPK